jgi:protein-tyrosine phosphatase
MLVLFICRANLNRSPRAAEIFRKLADQKGFDVEIQSAGTNAFFEGHDPQFLRRTYGVDRATQLTDEMLEKADIIVALDDEVREEIEIECQTKTKRIISLEIPDRYSLGRNNLDTLCGILNRKLEPLAEEISLTQRKRPSKETL